MNKMTVKDFIIYNSPCFSCGNTISLKLVVKRKGDRNKLSPSESIGFVINKDVVEIKLTVSYSFQLKLNIQYKTNKFITNNTEKFQDYMDKHDCHLLSSCNKCGTYIRSNVLMFDMDHNFINPIEIDEEYLKVRVDTNVDYMLHSFFEEKKSYFQAIVRPSNLKELPKTFITELPLIPLSKVKARHKFINKLKTYLIFS
jgi:hypothetical protein